MDIKLLVIFIILNALNVIIQTVKSLATVKCGKSIAALTSAIAYGLYTVVVVYMVCELPLWLKALIIALCNLVGVFVVKWAEEKARKDKLWKVEATVNPEYAELISSYCKTVDLPFNYIDIGKYYLFNFYCATQKESAVVKNLIEKYDAKYFVSESKTL